jgi:CO/xanthine dehydrogenase Mo-binding subunit
MRHIVLFALAIAAAFWLAPALHVLPQHAKTVAEVVIIGVFAAADLAVGWAMRRRPRPAPLQRTARYAAPARRR